MPESSNVPNNFVDPLKTCVESSITPASLRRALVASSTTVEAPGIILSNFSAPSAKIFFFFFLAYFFLKDSSFSLCLIKVFTLAVISLLLESKILKFLSPCTTSKIPFCEVAFLLIFPSDVVISIVYEPFLNTTSDLAESNFSCFLSVP